MKKMASKNVWLGILVIALVFGMTVISCSKNVDSSLNGTWEREGVGTIYKFKSGNYEIIRPDGFPATKGTYTTSDDKITLTITHVSEDGDYFQGEKKWVLQVHNPNFGSRKREYTYTVNGNILTLTVERAVADSKGQFLRYEENSDTYTLVNRNVKFSSFPTDNTKYLAPSAPSAPSTKSSGSASALRGRWSLEEGPSRNNPEDMDLLKDGTGIVDGVGISWKIENGRFYLIHSERAFSSIYNVSGKTLTLTTEDGVVLKYKKK